VRDGDAKLEGRLVQVEQGMHVVMGGVQRTLDAIQRDTADMKSGLAAVQRDTADMKSGLAAVQRDQADMKSGLAAVQRDTADMKSTLAAVQRDQADMKSGLADMKSGLAAVQQGQEDLASSQAAMASSQAAMDQKLSVLIEDRALGASKGMLADAHVARHRATAPLDLLQLLPLRLLGRADAQTELAKRVLAQLLEQRVPLALLRSIWRGLEVRAPPAWPACAPHGLHGAASGRACTPHTCRPLRRPASPACSHGCARTAGWTSARWGATSAAARTSRCASC
jgi:hypothetical protein